MAECTTWRRQTGNTRQPWTMDNRGSR